MVLLSPPLTFGLDVHAQKVCGNWGGSTAAACGRADKASLPGVGYRSRGAMACEKHQARQQEPVQDVPLSTISPKNIS